jgi:hypothetical protein
MRSKSLKYAAICCVLLAALATLLAGCQSPIGGGGQTYAGTKFYTGTTAPASSLGSNGDLYLDTTAGMVYVNTSGTWTSIASLKGAQGAPGAQAPGWLFGSGAPGSTLGTDGELYVDTTNTIVYKKSSGAWSQVATLGGVWQVGQGNPNEQRTGTIGDFYLDLLSTLVYKCTASGNSSWTTLFSFQVVSPQYIFTPDFLNIATNGIAYGSNMFAAVGYNGTIITTSDGVNWSYQSFDAPSPPDPPQSVAAKRHVAPTRKTASSPVKAPSLARSAASTVRGTRALPADKLAAIHKAVLARKAAFRGPRSKGIGGELYGNNVDLYGVASDGTNFAAVGYDNNLLQPVIVTSTDGTNWTANQVLGNSSWLYGVTFANGNVVAVGSVYDSGSYYGCIMYGPFTTDPGDWDIIETNENDEYYCATANANGIFAGGENGDGNGEIVFDTFDDLGPEGDWIFQDITPPTPGNVTACGPVNGLTCANGGMVVAVGQSSSYQSIGLSSALRQSTAFGRSSGNSYSMILTSTYTETDQSGLQSSWSSHDIPSKVTLYGVVYGGGGFVAVGEAGKLFTSANSISWSLQDWAGAADPNSTYSELYFNGVAWGALNGGLYGIAQSYNND